MSNHSIIFRRGMSRVLLLAVSAFACSAQPALSESLVWNWQIGDCNGSSGALLEDQSVDAAVGTTLCVVPPSYLYTQPSGPSLRWYVGIEMDGSVFSESTHPDTKHCITTSSNPVSVHSSTYCTTFPTRYSGTITFEPAGGGTPSGAWLNDFSSSDELDDFDVINPTTSTSIDIAGGALQMNIPAGVFDLGWVNSNAPRVMRGGGGGEFELETRLNSAPVGGCYTYLSGLYLVSDDGNGYNDLIFGASNTNLKIDYGIPSSHNFEWVNIGDAHSDLFLRVERDSTGNFAFRYKTAPSGSWIDYQSGQWSSVQGWSFNRVGLITKTWYTCQGVTANFDYLAHNYTPPAIQPGTPDVDYGTSGSNATVTVTTDTDPSDGGIGASVGAAVYAYGTTDTAPDVQESWANGGLEFSVADAKTLFLNVSLGGLMGGDHIFTSEFEAAALIRNVTDNSVMAAYPGSYEYLTTRPLPYGFKEVSDVQSIPYEAAPGKTYRLEFSEALTATATGSGSYGWANFGGSLSAMSSEIPVEDLPQADAGSDQVVAEGTIVQLDGSLSEDPDGDGLSFAWQQVSGDDLVTLSDPTVPNPTFLASVPGLYGFELIVSDGSLSSVPDYVTVLVESASAPINVEIDLQPGSEMNCVNINGHGLITVAVNGSDAFDVTDVDIETLSFAGLSTRVKGNGEPQCAYEDWNQDGFVDLTCHFVDDPEEWEPGEGIVTLTGELLDGTHFSGTDVLCVLP